MESNQEIELIIKLLLLGDTAVGKTSILLKYINDTFDQSVISTIGVDYMDKTIDYDKYKIKLQIWDTSGQERFRSITRNFYRNADGVMVVFDLTKKVTYDHVKVWLSEAYEHNEDITTILIGNKLDLVNERDVSKEIAVNFANNNKLKYLETSAKNGTNIKESFNTIIDLLLKGKTEQEIINDYTKHDSNLSIESDDKETKKKKKSCCK